MSLSIDGGFFAVTTTTSIGSLAEATPAEMANSASKAVTVFIVLSSETTLTPTTRNVAPVPTVSTSS
jgi:hypothetical protein